jgi:hypothetical protein
VSVCLCVCVSVCMCVCMYDVPFYVCMCGYINISFFVYEILQM